MNAAMTAVRRLFKQYAFCRVQWDYLLRLPLESTESEVEHKRSQVRRLLTDLTYLKVFRPVSAIKLRGVLINSIRILITLAFSFTISFNSIFSQISWSTFFSSAPESFTSLSTSIISIQSLDWPVLPSTQRSKTIEKASTMKTLSRLLYGEHHTGIS